MNIRIKDALRVLTCVARCTGDPARIEGCVIPFSPMLLGRASKPFKDPAWSYEIKWDGWRAIVAITGKGVRAWTRHGNDITARFPELQALSAAVTSPAVLDGELCALDDEGYPRFDWIMRRSCPTTLVAFDVLRIGRRNVIDLTLRERRTLLADVIRADSPHVLRSRPVADGIGLYRECERRGIEA